MNGPGAAALSAALILACCGRAAADPAAPAWKLKNPFCDVLAGMSPAGTAGDYGIILFARAGTALDAHVTMIGDTAAYDAHVTAVLEGGVTDRHTAPVIVRFAKPTAVRYFFVDSYAIDGAAATTCPSYVFPGGAGPAVEPAQPFAAQIVRAAYLQDLPALPCGHVYTPPGIGKGFEPIVGHFGDTPRDALLYVYVDSKGNAVEATLERTSGIEGIDDAALGGVEGTRYRPAELLCTPVVSELEMEMKYQP